MARPRSAQSELGQGLAGAAQPIYLLNSQRVIVYANPACELWLETPVEQLLGQRCDYHSSPSATAGKSVVAGLAPPPEAFLESHTPGIVTHNGPSFARRVAHFYGLQPSDDADAVLLAIVEPIDLADGAPRTAALPSASAELHVLVRWLRQTIAARPALERWLGELPAVRRMRDQYQAAAQSSARVVLIGPRGAGREDLARGLHYRAKSETTGPLIPIDCPLVDAESLQTAITSLVRRNAAQSPTQTAALLLADVDQLSPAAQLELQGFLQVPGFAVRTIATSQRSLLALAEQGSFRLDLAYVLSTLTIELPTLHARRSELPLIVQALVEEFNATGGKQLSGVAPDALERLVAYNWPGDLQQLAEAMQAACTTASGSQVGLADLPGWLRQAEQALLHPRREESPVVLDELLADVEREVILRALARSKQNKAKAAKLLGISRPRLLRRIEQLGLAVVNRGDGS